MQRSSNSGLGFSEMTITFVEPSMQMLCTSSSAYSGSLSRSTITTLNCCFSRLATASLPGG